ncbi:MAG: molybdenum ABC transporter ATP-binding protein [Desulfovibrio sp.]|nr:molybdenum ABC transporter ATP-binding protein [Desulfovibrio sp.]
MRVKRTQGRFLVDVDFTGASSGVTALYGPSGAGKSSVIGMIAGLARPDSGRIAIGDRALFDSGRGIDLPPEKRRVGCVFQDGRLFPHLSVRSNLTYGMKLISPAERKIPLDQVIDLLGIGHLLDRNPKHLSGGEKQRAAIGRALLISPSALLMDEPLASLDPARKDELIPYIACVGREFSIPVLYVSHSLQEIRRLTDRIVFLRDGRVEQVAEC